jgi:hypothetical protein
MKGVSTTLCPGCRRNNADLTGAVFLISVEAGEKKAE